MKNIQFLCLFAFVPALLFSEETESDRMQEAINQYAYEHRFDREDTPDEATGVQVSPDEDTDVHTNPNWKMVLMTGDDSIKAFDNARKKLFQLFNSFGIDEAIQLSRKSSEQVNGVRATSIANLEKAAHDLKVQEGDGCLIFMTSHGSQAGFYIRGQSSLTPSKLNQIISSTCGSRPTVVLVSACYSGIFAEPSMQAANRVILTAARKDKTSFGCSAEAEYTYWDSCLIENLPLATTWFELAGKIEKCIEKKESQGGFGRSYPQARFGANVKDLLIKQ